MDQTFERLITDVAHHWSYWQPDIPYEIAFEPRTDGQAERRRAGQLRKTISLNDFDPKAQPFSLDDPDQDLALLTTLGQELSKIQLAFAAEKRQKVLIILMGTDASAPGEVVHEFFAVPPSDRLRIARWRAPTGPERDRDYLWRYHHHAPSAGEITVFERGHYAELLAPVVNGWINNTERHQRIGHINDFERMLSHTGTVILKFMLHTTEDEHRQRLQARWRDPEQCAALNTSDFDNATQWPAYKVAYENILSATHTPWAPWTVVPSSCTKHRNLMMAAVLHQVLRNMES